MPYPIIIPEYFKELSDETSIDNVDNEYKVIFSPAAVEYVFPLGQDAVLKKLMEIKDPISFKMVSMKPEAEEEYSAKGRELVKETPILEHYWALKTLTMNIIQNRNYSMEKRFLLLNFACRTAQNMIDQGKAEIIPQFVGDFTSRPLHDEVMKYFEEIKPGFIFSLTNALSLLRAMPDDGGMDTVRFSVFKNTGTDIDFSSEVDMDKYMVMKKAYSEDFLKGREHYIENVMVNYVWSLCMPFADSKLNLWDNFVFFNVMFNTIKVMLTCYTYDRDDKDEAFMTAMKAFDLSFAAIKVNFVRSITDTLKEDDLTNNGDMAIMSLS